MRNNTTKEKIERKKERKIERKKERKNKAHKRKPESDGRKLRLDNFTQCCKFVSFFPLDLTKSLVRRKRDRQKKSERHVLDSFNKPSPP